MESQTTNDLKPLSKGKEMNLHSMKLKEESISTLLTTLKANQKFEKLLIYFLNSLQGFISPPNKDININSKIILKFGGVEIFHLISINNIKKEEILSLMGDIFYKLISINDICDKEMTKLFAEKDGHKAIIDILLKRKEENKDDALLLPFFKIINALANIPQIIPNLIENDVVNALNIDSDDNINNNINYNKENIKIKLNVLKQISTQKFGREYLIKNNYCKKINNLVHNCSSEKDEESVLLGLSVIENLCKNEEDINELRSEPYI